MGLTLEQYKQFIAETFPDNVTRSIAENDLRDGLNAMADFVFDTNSSTYIQEKLGEVEEFKISAEEAAELAESKRQATQLLSEVVAGDKAAVQLIKDQAQAILDNALVATNPQGEWNAATNTPPLTAVPVAGVNGTYYDNNVAALAPFSGSNFTQGVTTIPVGAKLAKKNATTWYMILPPDAAYSKAVKLEKDTALAELMTENGSPTSLNGGTATATAISIPVGQTGYQSAIVKTLQLANHTNWAVGKNLRVYLVFSESDINLHTSKINVNLNVNRSGSTAQNQAAAISYERIVDANTVRYQFDYTIQAGDTWIQPFMQIKGSGVSNAGSTPWVFTLKNVYVEILNPSTETNKISEKFKSVDEKATLNATNIAANAAAIIAQAATISAKLVNHMVVPTSFNGQAVAGASGNASSRISIPATQTGNGSYVRALIPIAEFPNWADMIGIPVTFSYKVLTSDNFYPGKSLTSVLTVTRSGADTNPSISGNSITILSPNVLRVQFTYTPTASDSVLKPYIQTSGAGAAVVADSFFEMQEITYSHAIPLGFMTENDYSKAKEKAAYIGLIRALAARATSLESQLASVYVSPEVVLTVSPDGSKMFTSPKLANDSITDSSKYKPYRILIYPGVYTDTEVTVKPYTVWEGTNRETCWLKGELPESATDGQITNTSTIWLKKTSGLRTLKITAETMRYAIHSEESGANVDAEHKIFNCHIEHYGMEKANAYRAANSLPEVSWKSGRPYGYGAASNVTERYENCTFVSPIEALYAHNNKDFAAPNINTAIGCSYIRTNFGKVGEIESLGSGRPDVMDLRNCDFSCGYIRHSDSPWITVDPEKQYANHAEYNILISGHQTPVGYLDNTRGRALRISSNNVAGASTVRVSGTAANVLFGKVIEKDFGFGVKGYAYGDLDNSGILAGLASNVTVTNSLGRRLGDCSTVNKTMSVTINGGAPVVIGFNIDYTAVANSTILTSINAALGSAATADLYNVAAGEVYPQMVGKQLTLVNNSDSVTIPAWSALCYDTDKSKVRLMTSADSASKFVGFNPFAIGPKKSGRVLWEGILHKSQGRGLSAAAIVFGSDISISTTDFTTPGRPLYETAGIVETSSAKVIGQGVGTDWFQFKGTI